MYKFKWQFFQWLLEIIGLPLSRRRRADALSSADSSVRKQKYHDYVSPSFHGTHVNVVRVHSASLAYGNCTCSMSCNQDQTVLQK